MAIVLFIKCIVDLHTLVSVQYKAMKLSAFNTLILRLIAIENKLLKYSRKILWFPE